MLTEYDAAVNQWALETHQTTGATVSDPTSVTPYIKLNANSSLPACPAGGAYVFNAVGVNPQCSLGNSVTPGHYLP